MQYFRYVISILTIVLTISVCHGQELINGVVQIISSDADGNEKESGSGIVVGQIGLGRQLHIVTAFHVIGNPQTEEIYNSVKVKFKHRPYNFYVAKVFQDFDTELDLAVLIIEVGTTIRDQLPRLEQLDIESLTTRTNLKAIGLPEKKWQTSNHIKFNNNDGPIRLSVSKTGIVPGYSGGAVFSTHKNRIVGMITKINPMGQSVSVLRMDVITARLRDWGIQYDFILPKVIPWKKSTLLWSVLGAGTIGSGIYFNNEASKKFDIVNSNLDPTAYTDSESSLFDSLGGKTRQEVEQEGDDFLLYRNISYGVAGALILTTILVNRKKLFRNSSNGSTNFSLDPKFSFNNEGASFGLQLNF